MRWRRITKGVVLQGALVAMQMAPMAFLNAGLGRPCRRRRRCDCAVNGLGYRRCSYGQKTWVAYGRKFLRTSNIDRFAT